MKNIFKFNQSGLTLIEILLVIAIMGIISTAFYVNVNKSMPKKVTESSDEMLSALRQMRNLAISKTVYKFAGDAEAKYPAGGYGITFDGTVTPKQYFIYAERGIDNGYQDNGPTPDEKIGLVVNLPANIELINDAAVPLKKFYYTILNERQAVTDMVSDSDKRYVVKLIGLEPGASKGHQAWVRIGEASIDNFILTNIGAIYSEYIPPSAPGGEEKKDPIDVGL